MINIVFQLSWSKYIVKSLAKINKNSQIHKLLWKNLSIFCKFIDFITFLKIFYHLNIFQKSASAFRVCSALCGYCSIKSVKNFAQSIFSSSICCLRCWNTLRRSVLSIETSSSTREQSWSTEPGAEALMPKPRW